MWRLLKEERVTHFNAAPTVNTMLCAAKEAERLPEPVRVTVAASPPSAHLLQQMTDLNLHPVHVYGMTESNGPTTKQYHKPEWEDLPANERYQTVSRQGYAFVASKPVRVIKTDGDHDAIIDVEKNGLEVGEIVLTGNTCGSGYYKNVEATKELFRGGWLHTGDLAVWHPDGSIQIMDRQKDIIISGKSRSALKDTQRLILPSRRRKHLLHRPRIHAHDTSGHPRSRRHRPPRRAMGRNAQGLHHRQIREANSRRRSDCVGEEIEIDQWVYGAEGGGDCIGVAEDDYREGQEECIERMDEGECERVVDSARRLVRFITVTRSVCERL